MHPVRRGIAAVSLALAILLALGAAPAHAERWSHQDAVGDVRLSEYAGDEETFTAAPDQASADIVKVVGAHRRTDVRIRIRTRAPFPSDWNALVELKTPRKHLMVVVYRYAGSGGGVDLLDLGSDSLGMVECRGVKRAISANRRVLTLTLPRRCLANPRSVRFGAGFVGLRDPESAYVDDGLRKGLRRSGLTLSPRLGRG